MMRGLVWLILGIGMIFAVSPASAQRLETKYPVCMEVYGSSGARMECFFWSMEQCWAATDGMAALCLANRYYVPLAQEAQSSPHPRRFQLDH
jgi:hypothetical protein